MPYLKRKSNKRSRRLRKSNKRSTSHNPTRAWARRRGGNNPVPMNVNSNNNNSEEETNNTRLWKAYEEGHEDREANKRYLERQGKDPNLWVKMYEPKYTGHGHSDENRKYWRGYMELDFNESHGGSIRARSKYVVKATNKRRRVKKRRKNSKKKY
tara:strand:- start:26454 stop:26918 length:465 start_codon:yes stop_codon:yes gene_type:complete